MVYQCSVRDTISVSWCIFSSKIEFLIYFNKASISYKPFANDKEKKMKGNLKNLQLFFLLLIVVIFFLPVVSLAVPVIYSYTNGSYGNSIYNEDPYLISRGYYYEEDMGIEFTFTTIDGYLPSTGPYNPWVDPSKSPTDMTPYIASWSMSDGVRAIFRDSNSDLSFVAFTEQGIPTDWSFSAGESFFLDGVTCGQYIWDQSSWDDGIYYSDAFMQSSLYSDSDVFFSN
jgi:hypothetical protein